MLQMFQRLYKRVSFRALDKLERPFIFAYSALVNDDVQKKTKECGFDDCIASKLGPDELQDVIHQQIDPFVEIVIDRTLKTLKKSDLMKQIIRKMDYAQSFGSKYSPDSDSIISSSLRIKKKFSDKRDLEQSLHIIGQNQIAEDSNEDKASERKLSLQME